MTTNGGKLGFVEVGARGGLFPRATDYLDRFECAVTEVDPDEVAALASAAEGRYAVFPTGLAHVDGERTLHLTANRSCSSMLRPDLDLLSRYAIADAFAPDGTVEVPCSRYDTIRASGEGPFPHVVRIDARGFEYQVLLGFGRLLQGTLAIEVVGAGHRPHHVGQGTLADVAGLLAGFDMALRTIRNPRSPNLEGDPLFDGDLVEVNAFFTKSRDWLGRHGAEREDFRLACELLSVDSY